MYFGDANQRTEAIPVDQLSLVTKATISSRVKSFKQLRKVGEKKEDFREWEHS